MDRREINAVLASAGLRPRHEFGQNFMVDQGVLRAIADAGEIGEEDVVLEIGPGVGNLTRLLAQRATRGAVLAADIDRKLLPAAARHHAELKNVTWLLGDALAGKHAIAPAVLEQLRALRAGHGAGKLKLVSNLPYNAASPLVAELLVEMWREVAGNECGIRNGPCESVGRARGLLFERLVFTVQWEVGRRMAAEAGEKGGGRDYGPLGILLQLMGRVEIVKKIGAGAFWPPPKIASALVVLKPDIAAMHRVNDAPRLQEFLAGIFAHRRQTLGNALKHFLGERWTDRLKVRLAAEGFDLGLRPEIFAPGEFPRLLALVPPW